MILGLFANVIQVEPSGLLAKNSQLEEEVQWIFNEAFTVRLCRTG